MSRNPIRSPAPVDVDCEIRVVTDRGIAVWAGAVKEVADGRFSEQWTWLPRSQCQWWAHPKGGDRRINLRIPSWLYHRNGLADAVRERSRRRVEAARAAERTRAA